MKKTKKLGFQLAIPLSFEVLATQPDFVARDIALKLYSLIMDLLLKFLDMVEILLANVYKVLEIER